MTRSFPIGANGGPVWPLLSSKGPKRSPEATVGAVGDNHIARRDIERNVGVFALNCRSADKTSFQNWSEGFVTFKQSCSGGDRIARHHCVQFSAPHDVAVLWIDRMRGPVQFNGLAVSRRAQSVVTMELRELIAKTHIVDLLDSSRG